METHGTAVSAVAAQSGRTVGTLPIRVFGDNQFDAKPKDFKELRQTFTERLRDAVRTASCWGCVSLISVIAPI